MLPWNICSLIFCDLFLFERDFTLFYIFESYSSFSANMLIFLSIVHDFFIIHCAMPSLVYTNIFHNSPKQAPVQDKIDTRSVCQKCKHTHTPVPSTNIYQLWKAYLSCHQNLDINTAEQSFHFIPKRDQYLVTCEYSIGQQSVLKLHLPNKLQYFLNF